MKKITLGLATAALLGLAAFSAPASAFPAPQLGASAPTNVVDVQYRHRKVCTVRTIVTRSHGQRMVRKVRTCH
jgi:hypothetical protein